MVLNKETNRQPAKGKKRRRKKKKKGGTWVVECAWVAGQ